MNKGPRDDLKTLLQEQLFRAIERKKTDEVQSCIKSGANVNVSDKNNVTPLMKALEIGNMDIEKTLLEAKADVNHRDNHGNTVLHYAACSGSHSIKDLLSSENINAKNKWGQTPLIPAVDKRNPRCYETIKTLVQERANIEATMNDGQTAMHMAAAWGNTEAIAGLLDHKANIDATDSKDMTPLKMAIRYNQLDAVKCLMQNEVDVYPALTYAIKQHPRREPIVHALALEGAKGQNRYFTNDQYRPDELSRSILAEDRQQQLKDNALYYLACALLNDETTKKDYEVALDSFDNENFIKGMKILSNPSMPSEIRKDILSFSNRGPLTYTLYEDNKAKDIANSVVESTYRLTTKM